MYKVDNKQIGTYLGKEISKKIGPDRQFAIAYLRLRDNVSNPAPDEIAKMQNKICQIKKGNKGIQITDLPYFAEILKVSVDDILSAGTSCKPVSNRVSNYSIAFSKNKKDWEEYIKRPDKLILNSDEYGKTVIDYALEFSNYDFLKYLMDNGYIWFVGQNQDEYYCGFGAGTKIERRNIIHTDNLDIELKQRDELRTNLITLAIEKGDFSVLDELKAREIHALYQASFIMYQPLDFDKYYNKTMIDTIADGDDKALTYFSEEFEIKTNRDCRCIFTFPFLGELLDSVIKKHRKCAAKMLKNALKHNKNVLSSIEKIYDASSSDFDEGLRQFYTEESINRQILDNYRFFNENDTVNFHSVILGKDSFTGLFTNVIKITVNCKDDYLSSIIEDVNDTYEKIANYKKETED